MNMAIKKDVLLEHLNYVIKGVSTRNIIPVLNGIKFELTSEGLSLIGSDNDLTIKTFIGKKDIDNIKTPGEIVILGKYIYEIIKKLPNDIINIEVVDTNRVSIYTNNSSFDLNGISANEYPNFDLEEIKEPLIMKQKVFKNIINQVGFATSLQESRPVLTGINFKLNGNNLECTATDSYRLAKKNLKIKDKINSFDVIIPYRNLSEIIKILGDGDNEIEIHIFNNKVIFKYEDLKIQSRLLNGTYPDTSKLIPTDFLVSLKVGLTDFYNVIDRASLLTTDTEKNIIKLELKGEEIIVSSNIPEIGKVEEKLLIEKNNKENLVISFSSKFMLDALKAIQSEVVEISFKGEINPIIIKNPNDNEVIQLILPIRTY